MASYKVIFLGLAVAGLEEEARLITGLQKKFNLSREKAERLLQRVPIVVKKGITREEMERYVKAFGEMGGRVRVEEEAVTEPLEIPVPSAPQQKMMTCPQCGFEQVEGDVCVKCGIVISKYFEHERRARPLEGPIREIPPEEEVPPWESGEGFFSAFLKTAWEALSSPTKFFRKVSAGEGYLSALIFGTISGVIGFGGTFLWQWLTLARVFLVPRFAYPVQIFPFIAVMVAMPFLVAFSILLGSCVTHLCLMIVGGNKKGFESTFRAISYSLSGDLFGIIPFIGGTIGGIYALVLIIIGVREGHGISTGRAILAVLLPIIVAAGFGILAAILIPLFLGRMFFGGIGV